MIDPPFHFQKFELPFKGVHIQCLDWDGKPIKGVNASGFIRREGGINFLYTCWHVVTGFDMHNLVILNELPKRASLKVTLQNSDSRQPDISTIGGQQEFVVDLYKNHNTPFEPLWYQDKLDTPQADLNSIGLRVPFWHDAVKIKIPNTVNLTNLQVVDDSQCLEEFLSPTDRVFIVGFPYGYSALGMGQPTPIILTRHIAGTRIEGRKRELLLDSSGASGMSGGPVFAETSKGYLLTGLYTGIIYPDYVISQYERGTALGTYCDLALTLKILRLEPYANS